MDKKAIQNLSSGIVSIVSQILDETQTLGLEILFRDKKPLLLFIDFLRELEGKLLYQWDLLENEQDLERYHEQTKYDYAKLLRQKNSIFQCWNDFLRCFHEEIDDNMVFDEDLNLWENYILSLLLEKPPLYFFQKLDSEDETNLEKRNNLLRFYYSILPDDLWTHYLNILEISLQKRANFITAFDNHFDRKNNTLAPFFKDSNKTDIWEKSCERLEEFWLSNSGGFFSFYEAFQFGKLRGKYRLKPIRIKSVFFEDLYFNDFAKERLKNNIENFLKTGIGQHVLLWGYRGTGKSSSVIALANAYKDQNVRLIEIKKRDLIHLDRLRDLIHGAKEKFILFCDDVSFDKEDKDYQILKTMMEGSLSANQDQFLIHMTSNRKDLVVRGYIDERLAEKKHVLDEKRSIDDRFGLKLYFDLPEKKKLDLLLDEYVEKMNLKIDREQLHIDFHQFCLENNHDKPSIRTVNQFMNWMEK